MIWSRLDETGRAASANPCARAFGRGLMAEGIAWAIGAYLVGTFPATFVIAKLKGAHGLLAAAGGDAGETDAHILMTKYLGARWSTMAATTDVLKAFVYLLAARHLGGLSEAWLGVVGVLVVAGHMFPFYARHMAGRGASATAGVLLVLLPWEMVVAGVIIVAGVMVKNAGLATTMAFALVPAEAALQGQPREFVVMSAVIFVLIMLRRLQGVGSVVAGGISVSHAVAYRCLFDSSGPPADGRRRPEEPGQEPGLSRQ